MHRVLAFTQSRWLQPYIEKNTALRSVAKNEFEKEFFKLMNNSIYGKTCENQKKRTDIKLVTTEQKCKKLTEKPHCLGFRIFDETLAGVEMQKLRTMIDKPFYVGFCVLELSKLHMYRYVAKVFFFLTFYFHTAFFLTLCPLLLCFMLVFYYVVHYRHRIKIS